MERVEDQSSPFGDGGDACPGGRFAGSQLLRVARSRRTLPFLRRQGSLGMALSYGSIAGHGVCRRPAHRWATLPVRPEQRGLGDGRLRIGSHCGVVGISG